MLDVLQKLEGWQSRPAADLAAELAELVTVRKPGDVGLEEGAWATGARGLRDFGAGPTGWGGMKSALVALGLGDVAEQLAYGMDFGHPQTQGMIDQLGALAPDVFTPERVSILKGWGVTSSTRWSQLGGQGEPPAAAAIAKVRTVEDCRVALLAELQSARSKCTAANAWLDVLDLEAMDAAAVAAYCDELLASSDGNPAGT